MATLVANRYRRNYGIRKPASKTVSQQKEQAAVEGRKKNTKGAANCALHRTVHLDRRTV